MGRGVVTLLLGFLGRLRFPYLFGLVALLFLLDLLIPDVLPLADELLLGSATVLLGAWKKRRSEGNGHGDQDGEPPERPQEQPHDDSAI